MNFGRNWRRKMISTVRHWKINQVISRFWLARCENNISPWEIKVSRNLMRSRRPLRMKGRNISRKQLMKLRNVSRDISRWSKNSQWVGRNSKNNSKRRLTSWESRACKPTTQPESRWKMISKTLRSAMRKWKLSINSTHKNWTTTWSYWRKRRKKTMRIMNNWRRKSQFWTTDT